MWGRRKPFPGALSLYASPEALQLIDYLPSHQAGGPVVRSTQSWSLTTDSQIATVLSEHVAQHVHLKQREVWLVLPLTQYRLLLMDAPKVPSTEMTAALSWLVGDLIDFAVDEAVIDWFYIPATQATLSSKVYVAIVRRSILQQWQSWCEQAELHLARVSIAECAYARCLSIDPHFEMQGILVMTPERVDIIIVQQGMISYCRAISRRRQESSFNSDALALEIQRSLDYCQTQLKQIPPRQMRVVQSEEVNPELLSTVSAQLSLSFVPLSLVEYVSGFQEADARQRFLSVITIGNALQADYASTSTIEWMRNLPKPKQEYCTARQLQLGLLGLLVFLGGMQSWHLWQREILSRTLQQTLNETVQLAGDLAKLQGNAKENNPEHLSKTLQSRSQLLAVLKKKSVINLRGYSDEFLAIAKAIVSGVWLTHIQLSGGESKVLLEGRADNTRSVLAFLNRLNNSSVFENRKLSLSKIEQPTTTQEPLYFTLLTQENKDSAHALH